jgi:hypothetical protein
MPSTIQFLRDPRYTDTVVLFILSPAGVQYAVKDIGHNLFGSDDWIEETLLIDGLSPKAGFRYSDISFHWTDFLDLAFRHVDHALFYVPHKSTFKEIRKESLLQQNPDLYTFSFRKFYCEARKGMILPAPEVETPIFPMPLPAPPMSKSIAGSKPLAGSKSIAGSKPTLAQKPLKTPVISSAPANILKEGRATLHALLASGWSANAVAKQTGITAMTIGSIKNGKSSQMSGRVHDAIMRMKADADAGRITPASRKAQNAVDVPRASTSPSAKNRTSVHSHSINKQRPGAADDVLVSESFIAVDAQQLITLLDHLGSIFTDSVEELQEIRSMLSHKR